MIPEVHFSFQAWQRFTQFGLFFNFATLIAVFATFDACTDVFTLCIFIINKFDTFIS